MRLGPASNANVKNQKRWLKAVVCPHNVLGCIVPTTPLVAEVDQMVQM